MHPNLDLSCTFEFRVGQKVHCRLLKSELQLTNHPPRGLFEDIHVPRNLYKLLHDLLLESYASFSLVGSEGDPIVHHQWSYDCVKTGDPKGSELLLIIHFRP
jgi:hypothetical protein